MLRLAFGGRHGLLLRQNVSRGWRFALESTLQRAVVFGGGRLNAVPVFKPFLIRIVCKINVISDVVCGATPIDLSAFAATQELVVVSIKGSGLGPRNR